jgi:hypothetical protein
MKQENKLERKSKEFDLKEWIPIAGLYFVPRNIFSGRCSRVLKKNKVVNGIYHGTVSFYPIFYVINEYLLA